ncbi:hypothetical protein ERJ75_000168400 [Trypanosoma vivax]|nr:hypothetical protein ERJ75_000168400 [Trypanosoma vivax]
MKRSAKGADALNEAVARGIRMAAKRTIPKDKGVAPAFWTLELTKLDKMVQECKNRQECDAPWPLTSPVLALGGHPLTKHQQAQALAKMRMAMSTKAP